MDLEALLVEWQKILRMQDWDFTIKIKRHYDMPIKDTQGGCSWLLAKRRGVISILDPVDYDPAIVDEQDREITLVHEMLHPLLGQFESEASNDSDNLEWAAKEQTIDCIAKALVKLKRSAEKVDN